MPTKSLSILIRGAAIAALLATTACSGGGDGNDIAEIDNQLIANDADPALTSALEDQILVDPTLVQQSNATAVRPPETPVQAQYPPGRDPGESSQVRRAASRVGAAAGAESGGEAGLCGALDYNARWASRLPAEFPAYPGWRVTDAAGHDGSTCTVRVVTFRTGDAPGRVLGWYRGRAQQAGYSADQETRGADHLLGGVNQRTDTAFVVIVTPLERGSDVAVIVNRGS